MEKNIMDKIAELRSYVNENYTANDGLTMHGSDMLAFLDACEKKDSAEKLLEYLGNPFGTADMGAIELAVWEEAAKCIKSNVILLPKLNRDEVYRSSDDRTCEILEYAADGEWLYKIPSCHSSWVFGGNCNCNNHDPYSEELVSENEARELVAIWELNNRNK